MLAGGMAGQIQTVRTIMPDFQITIDGMIAEGNKVVVRLTQRGTNTGPIVGLPGFGKFENPLPPTGNTITLTAIEVFTIADSKNL